MAQRHSEFSTVAMILLVLLLYLYPVMETKIPELCDPVFSWPNQLCNHNQSGLCGFNSAKVSCTHQLRHTELTFGKAAAECQMERFSKDCGPFQSSYSYIYAHEKPLVRLHPYYFSTWLRQQSVVNFTFPSPDWNSLLLHYKVNNSHPENFCLRFNLHGVSLPLKDTLVYDCQVFIVPGDIARDAQVMVQNDKGEGRTFTFRLPSRTRMNPLKTQISEWHVFFYLHQDFIATSSHLPVTVVPVSPFSNVSYRVSIVKCKDVDNQDCGNYATLNSTLVAYPKEEEWTVMLPIWSNPGNYAVTVQIVSDSCSPITGCYVSVSPKFEIRPSYLGIWISVGMGFFLIAFLTFLLMFSHRLKTNKKILHALKETQPSVLLVYLAENHIQLEFINKFAGFLKNKCHLKPYLVDRDVGNQDPNCWTMDHILLADKVLFIVPENTTGDSITPIRNQWIIALNYISGHHFTTQQPSHKVAVVLLPSSGSIPCQIIHMRCFKVVKQISELVTWLHSGTWLDEVFLWRSKIRLSSQEKVLHSWPEIRKVAMRASSSTEKISQTYTGVSVMYRNILLKSTIDQSMELRNDISTHSDDSTTTDDESHASYSILDPDIPTFESLQMEEEGSMSSVYSQDSDEVEVQEGIFT